MNDQKQPDFELLMQRFDAGERSRELLDRLNHAAFQCFHAPWESFQDLRLVPADPAAPSAEGRLPLDMEEGEGDDDSDMEGLSFPGVLPSNEDAPTNPLERLSAALDSMGRLPYHAPGCGLMVDLGHDPRADNRSLLAFRANWEGKSLQMISRGDLSLTGLSELELERICRLYNRRATGLEAKTYRPHEGAALRLRLITTIPFSTTQSFPTLVEFLTRLFTEDRRFWRQVRRHRPS